MLSVICPGEFSIGPHADCAYGHSHANVNVVLPLYGCTGAGALVTESHEGAEDWHALDGRYGACSVFHGARCLHFAGENRADEARVSLDFRIVPAGGWEGAHDAQPVDGPGDARAGAAGCSAGANRYAVGFFVRMSRARDADGAWTIDEPDSRALPDPDERFGYPFVRRAAAAAH